MENIRPRLLTGSLVVILIGVVLGSIFFISSLVPDSSKTEISAFPTPNPDELSSPNDISPSSGDVAGTQTSPSPTKKPVPTAAKAKPTSTPAPTAAPTVAPTSTPAPTSEQTATPTPTNVEPSSTPAESPTPNISPTSG
ncbi:hypothetical protein A2769_00790 [Candidatus Daviesbacteria bacterium RIFCSPHIGHO2_01_FULL_37_27]|nr:MAG: hypothetical protein A2769_00790 [Candidatus Daviesbacteria bacterium RIFCSPHIGHO2_01_FULL_37_27]